MQESIIIQILQNGYTDPAVLLLVSRRSKVETKLLYRMSGEYSAGRINVGASDC